MVPEIFKYHKLCRENVSTDLLCFYDEEYLCICRGDHFRANCFMINHDLDRCSQCLSRGRCIQGNLNPHTDFLCLCARCYYGSKCQFNTEALGFTIDSLLANESISVKTVYQSLALVIFLIGIVTNGFSFFTFKRQQLRKTGVGIYLLLVTIASQTVLLFLLLKFIHNVTIATGYLSHASLWNMGLCKAISYFLSVFTRTSLWLTSWVTLGRLAIVIFPTRRTNEKRKFAMSLSVGTLLIVAIMHLHELKYFVVVEDENKHSLCVSNFDHEFILKYNRVNILLHYMIPFLIQVISITLLIILVTRNRMKTSKNTRNFLNVLKTQMKSQQELYITPAIIVCSAVPNTIVSFSFSCTELNQLVSSCFC